MTIIGSSNPFQTRIQSFESTPSSSTAASRTLTALPGGAIEDVFTSRTIHQPNAWMQSLAAACSQPQQLQAPQAESAAPAKKKKKKKGFGKKLKGLAKKAKNFAKKGIKTLKNIVKKPFDLVKQALGFAMNPLQLLGGGLPKQ